MPIPLGVSRSTFHGHLPGGEQFGWSLWCDEAPISQAAAQTQANFFANAFSADLAVGTGPDHLIGSDSGYDGVTVYSYLDAGGKARYIAEGPINKPGVNAGAILPNQASLVVSLHTALAGRRHKGRVYLPLTRLALSAGGQLDQGLLDALSTWFATFVGHLNGDAAPGKVCIVSQVSGDVTPVNSIKIDSRVDIQRRRANRQLAATSSSHVIA